jgi:hypothetical protein
MQGRAGTFIAIATSLCAPLIAGFALAAFAIDPDTHPDRLWIAQPQQVSGYSPYTGSVRI